MKAERKTKPKTFEPITVTLETEQELIGLYCLLSHARLREAAGFPEMIADHTFKSVIGECNTAPTFQAICCVCE